MIHGVRPYIQGMTTNTNTAAAAVNLIPSTHVDLAGRYGCRAYQTVVTFLFAGIVHRARRFFRSDMPTTGQIELYTIEPYPAGYTNMTVLGWYDSAFSEDFLGYAAGDSRRDRLARGLIEAALAGDGTGAEQTARFELLELT